MTIDFSKVTFLKLKAKKLGYVALTKKTFKHVTEERERERENTSNIMNSFLKKPSRIPIILKKITKIRMSIFILKRLKNTT